MKSVFAVFGRHPEQDVREMNQLLNKNGSVIIKAVFVDDKVVMKSVFAFCGRHPEQDVREFNQFLNKMVKLL